MRLSEEKGLPSQESPAWSSKTQPGLCLLLYRDFDSLLPTLFLSSDWGTFFFSCILKPYASQASFPLLRLASAVWGLKSLFLFWSQPGKDIRKLGSQGGRREVGELQVWILMGSLWRQDKFYSPGYTGPLARELFQGRRPVLLISVFPTPNTQ